MGRSKRKRVKEKVKYVKGATWQDVLSGRPVTADDLKKRQSAKQEWANVAHKCRRCSNTAIVPVRVKARNRAAVTCFRCGGKMDAYCRVENKS